MKAATSNFPQWHVWVLKASCLHSGIWGAFIIATPVRAATAYGFAKAPQDIPLWQGTGLFITLLAIGYGLASRNPVQHWGLVFIGLLAKILGPIGMVQAVIQGQVSPAVLWLLPINDIIWWLPFALIVRNGYQQSQPSYPAAD